MKDPVTIQHPTVKGTATVSRSAYDKVWKQRGWKLVKQHSPATTSSAPSEATSGDGSKHKQS